MTTTSKDLTPQRIDVSIMEGVDSPIEFTLADDGVAVDLTLETVKFTAKDGLKSTAAAKIGPKTNGPGAHYDPTNGKTHFTVLKTEAANATDKDVTWWYEVRLIRAADSLEFVYIWGKLIIIAGVGT